MDVIPHRYDYIDALRGFAIIGVILVHSSQWVAPESGILIRIASQGARGVQLFYVASALTLFMSMASRKEKEERLLIKYIIRRFFRIAPAFYLAIIVYTAFDGLSPRYWAPNGIEWWYIPLTAFFLHGWHPETITSVVPGGWTIAVEMTFYLFVPYLYSKLNSIKSTLITLFASLLIALLTSRIINYLISPLYPETHQYLVGSFAFLWFFSQLPVFILGILTFHIINKYPNKDKTVGSLLLFLSLFLFEAFLSTFLLPGHFLYGIAFLLFSLALYHSPQKIFVNRFTVLVGRLSFSIYLVHYMVLRLVGKLFSNGFPINGNIGFVLAFLLVLIISICISYVTYRFVETPGINFGKRIISKL